MWKFDGGYTSLNVYCEPTSWNFYVTDHLGSTRMVVDRNGNTRETINYYPFGSEMTMTPPAQLVNSTNKIMDANKTSPKFYMYNAPSKTTVRYDGNKIYR